MGLSGLSKLAEETGGETFSLSTSNPVSFKPYLETLEKLFNHQYYLVFRAVPKNKGGLQYVKVETQPKTKLRLQTMSGFPALPRVSKSRAPQ